MACVNPNCSSIGPLSIPWSHDQYSESRFKQQPLASDKSRTLKIWRKENAHGNQLSLPCLPEIKSHVERWPSVRPISSQPKVFIWKSFEERKGEWNQTKTKQETVENPLTGSAVNAMHFSIQVTHPSRTSKTGLSLTPILTGSGYCEPLGAVLNSNTLCLCGMHKHQHRLIKQKVLSGFWFCFEVGFHFLESYVQTLKCAAS